MREGAEKLTRDFLTDTDRNDAVLTHYRELGNPSKPGGKTAVRYMLDEHGKLMHAVTGSERDTLESVTKVNEFLSGILYIGNTIDELSFPNLEKTLKWTAGHLF